MPIKQQLENLEAELAGIIPNLQNAVDQAKAQRTQAEQALHRRQTRLNAARSLLASIRAALETAQSL